jgi:ABC-2 type transport system permease protein
LILYSVGLLIGRAIDITGWSAEVFSQFTEKFFKTSFLTFLLCTPVAFFASYGRGIIVPIGFLILSLVMAQFIALVGLGPYFPWAIPGVYTAPAGTEGMQLFLISYIILALTCVFGFIGTIAWWRFADHH